MPQLTLVELEQLHISRFFDDNRTMGTAAAESGSTHSDDFDFAITQIREIIYGPNTSGVGNWYDLVPAGLVDLVFASGVLNDEITSINTFLCRSTGQDNPTYTSTIFVPQGSCIASGISILDMKLAAVSGAVSAPTWTNVFDNGLGILDTTNFDPDIRLPDGRTWEFNDGAGANPIMEITNAQIFARSLGRRSYYQQTPLSVLQAGTEIVIPGGLTYTQDPSGINLNVHRNGVLLLPGTGVTSGDEEFNDYRESSTSGIVLNTKLRGEEVLQFKIFG